jgi:hypothetical protein
VCYDLYCADGDHGGGFRCFTAPAVDRFVRIMDHLGMLDHSASKVEWTNPDNSVGLTDEDWWALHETRSNPGTPLSPAAAEYQRQLRLLTDHQAPNPLGIPPHKLRTNDGWLVTAAEIRAALLFHAAASTHLQAPLFDSEEKRLFQEWIGWLELAAPRGGFRAY